MPLICVTSPKGGVGKTTLVANLAVALRTLGWRTVAIDFDVQNALRLHFGVPFHNRDGYVSHALHTPDWSQLIRMTPSGVGLLAYGTVDNAQRRAFENALADDPALLPRALKTLLSMPDCVIVADTPPGPSDALEALDRILDMRVAVLLPDATSVSLLPGILDRSSAGVDVAARAKPLFVVLNQVDRRSRLNADVTDFIKQQAGAALTGLIHRDEFLAEAVASRRSVLDYAPSSLGAQGIGALAQRIDAHLRGTTMSQQANRS